MEIEFDTELEEKKTTMIVREQGKVLAEISIFLGNLNDEKIPNTTKEKILNIHRLVFGFLTGIVVTKNEYRRPI